MAGVDLVDETYVVVERTRIAAVVADPARWRQWWPTLDLAVFMDRGLDGVRWSITGELVGSAEVWLEPQGDGVIVHYYLRGEPTAPGSPTTPRVLPTSARGRREMDRLLPFFGVDQPLGAEGDDHPFHPLGLHLAAGSLHGPAIPQGTPEAGRQFARIQDQQGDPIHALRQAGHLGLGDRHHHEG